MRVTHSLADGFIEERSTDFDNRGTAHNSGKVPRSVIFVLFSQTKLEGKSVDIPGQVLCTRRVCSAVASADDPTVLSSTFHAL